MELNSISKNICYIATYYLKAVEIKWQSQDPETTSNLSIIPIDTGIIFL